MLPKVIRLQPCVFFNIFTGTALLHSSIFFSNILQFIIRNYSPLGSGMTLSPGGVFLTHSTFQPYISVKSHATIKNLFPDKIFDIQTSFGNPILTVKVVWPSISLCQSRSLPVYQDFENRKNTKGSPLWNGKKILSPILMKFKTCNPYGLRISHTKFEWNRRQKIFPDSLLGPPFGKKNFFVSDFTQIFCVRPFDHKDFKF